MNIERLKRDIKRFLEVYQVLTPEARVFFEVQLGPKLNSSDHRSRALYLALLSAAKEGATIEEAVSKMENANQAVQRKSAQPG